MPRPMPEPLERLRPQCARQDGAAAGFARPHSSRAGPDRSSTPARAARLEPVTSCSGGLRVTPRSAVATPAKRVFRPPPSPPRPARPAASPSYRPRRPKSTPLYPVVRHHLETFLARAVEIDPLGNGVPWWIEKDFRAYLRCGILAHGLARARCEDCGHERLVPFSCKGRGICPSCNTRRMAELAAHLTDHVLPHLAARQWVLSLPKRLRCFRHHNPDIAGAVLRILPRAIRTTLRRASPGPLRAACGRPRSPRERARRSSTPATAHRVEPTDRPRPQAHDLRSQNALRSRP
jgi:hypothetical protein